jgi:hypothetical protein
MKTTMCRNMPSKKCLCHKFKWTKWLYLIPIALCAAFSFAFVELNNYYEDVAFDILAEDNHRVFDVLYDIGANDVGKFGEDVAEFYNDTIIPTASNTNFTFTYKFDSLDSSLNVIRQYIGDISIINDSTKLDTYIPGYGVTRIYKYSLGDDNYWIFGTYDGDIINYQKYGLSLIVFLALISTAVLNLIIIYKINQTIHASPK